MSLIDQAKARVEQARGTVKSKVDEIRSKVGVKGRLYQGQGPILGQLGKGAMLGKLRQGSMLGQQLPMIRDVRSRVQSRVRSAGSRPSPAIVRPDIVDTTRSAVEGVRKSQHRLSVVM